MIMQTRSNANVSLATQARLRYESLLRCNGSALSEKADRRRSSVHFTRLIASPWLSTESLARYC